MELIGHQGKKDKAEELIQEVEENSGRGGDQGNRGKYTQKREGYSGREQETRKKNRKKKAENNQPFLLSTILFRFSAYPSKIL